MDNMDVFTPLSTESPSPSLDDCSLTVTPADTHLRQPSVAFSEDVKDPPCTQENKPSKKRKSWGQELPVPTTNLPPRKRAKTEAEKEQRRVERVLRNRNAAHASRERKRAEVDQLQVEKNDIQLQRDSLARELEQSKQQIQILQDQVAKLSALITGPNPETSPSFNIKAPSPTLTSQLFKQEDQDGSPLDSVSKHPSPLPQAAFPTPPPILNEPVATPPELTQYPAAILCPDLQCHSEAVTMAYRQQMQMMVIRSIINTLFLTMISTYSSVALPLAQILTSIKSGRRLTPSATEVPVYLTLMTWLISRPSTTLLTHRSTFRFRLLQRLMACTPAMARPLQDATRSALQRATSGTKSLSLMGRQNVVGRRSLTEFMSSGWVSQSDRRGHFQGGDGGINTFHVRGRRWAQGRHVLHRRPGKKIGVSRTRTNVDAWRRLSKHLQ